MPRGTSTAQPNAQAQQDANSEGIDAYDLPRSLVTRIARSAVSSRGVLHLSLQFKVDKVNSLSFQIT